MGFLDKLLGRGKQAAEGVEDAAKDAGEKATDVASDVGDKAEEAFDEAKERVTGADEGDQGRMP